MGSDAKIRQIKATCGWDMAIVYAYCKKKIAFYEVLPAIHKLACKKDIEPYKILLMQASAELADKYMRDAGWEESRTEQGNNYFEYVMGE